MILADSSALIEYYRPAGEPSVQAAVGDAIAADLLAVNGIIQVEIIGFALHEKERSMLLADFSAFHQLPLEASVFALAADLGFDLRRRGRTVPATDLIIAASAISSKAELLHTDGHFREIAAGSDLLCRDPRESVF